jgi:hypothetical protein
MRLVGNSIGSGHTGISTLKHDEQENEAIVAILILHEHPPDDDRSLKQNTRNRQEA